MRRPESNKHMKEFKGGCHCGNVTYTFQWPLDGDLVLKKCGCTFCTKQGVIYTGHPRALLSVTVRNPELLSRYQFDTKTADCHFCARCGVYVYASSVIDGREYAVINVNSLAGFVAPPNVETLALGGEGKGNRLKRRSKTWIANVEVKTGAKAM